MRKINLFIGMVLTTVLLAACGQHNKPEFKGDISGENDLEQTQSYFTNGMHEVTKCPTGYYYMSEQEMAGVNLLKYYDNEEQKSIVLCNKPQCEHNSKECMAYLDMSEYKPKIYYYNSFIYMIRMNGDLEQISADGSERIVLGNVCNSGSSDTINVSFNGDTAYISKENEEGINGNIKVEIYAFNIQTKESKRIYSETSYAILVAFQRHAESLELSCSFADSFNDQVIYRYLLSLLFTLVDLSTKSKQLCNINLDVLCYARNLSMT